MSDITVGVLTVSDAIASGEARDEVGLGIADCISDLGWTVVAYHVCQGDEECIEASLVEMADVDEADIVLTLGGIGLGPRDVTPEATLAGTWRELPGIAEAVRGCFRANAPEVFVARNVAAQREGTIVVNFPEGPFDVVCDCLQGLAEEIERAVAALRAAGGG